MSRRRSRTRVAADRATLYAACALLAVGLFGARVGQAQVCGIALQKGIFGPAGPGDFDVSPGDSLTAEFAASYNCDENRILRLLSLVDDEDALSPDPGDVIGYPMTLGDQPGEITGISGNATCQAIGQASGTACDPLMPGNCVLPCIIGPALDAGADVGTQPTPGGALPTPTNLTLPGAVSPGRVDFITVDPLTVGPVCPNESPSTLDDRATLQNAFVCQIGEPGCNPTPNTANAPDTLVCVELGCPLVSINKTCDTIRQDGQCIGDVTITAQNADDGKDFRAEATNCTVTDTFGGVVLNLFEADGVTPAVQPFNLAPGETKVFKATTDPFTGTVNNVADIQCDAGSPPPGMEDMCQSTDTDEAACTCPEGENYKCYNVKYEPRSDGLDRLPVALEDQFGASQATVIEPVQVCNPVDKNGDGIINPLGHLMCYKLLNRTRTTVPVEVTDQFGTEQLRVSNGNVLCVPAIKNCEATDIECLFGLVLLQFLTNHYQCYDARPLVAGQDLIQPDPVLLTDQFGGPSEATFIGPRPRRGRGGPIPPPRSVCNPTAKNDGLFQTPIVDPEAHLKCYGIEDDSFPGTEIEVIDQFSIAQLGLAPWQLRVSSPSQLCEDAEKDRLDRP